MLDIGIGVSLEENSFSAAEEAIKRAKADLTRGRIDLCLLFNTPDFSAAGVVKAINYSLRDVPVAGASTPAIITEAGILKHGIAVMLIGFTDGGCCGLADTRGLSLKNPTESGEELAEKLLSEFRNIPRHLGLFLFDQQLETGPAFVSGIQEKLGRGFPCIAAYLSSQYDLSHSWLYYNNDVLTNSCTGLLWGGKTYFGQGIGHGWKPLGKPHTVSNSVGNIINAIDNKPAVEIYEDYLGLDSSSLRKDLNKLSVYYPIGIFSPNEQDYLLRNVVSVSERGALVCQGSIAEGSTIRLMISTPETCLAAVTEAIEQARKNLATKLAGQSHVKNSGFAIVSNSISRYNLLKRDLKKELALIKSGLGDTPFIGFYSSGELAPLPASGYHSQIYFHNQAFTVLIIEG